jgi:hypothetical protein
VTPAASDVRPNHSAATRSAAKLDRKPKAESENISVVCRFRPVLDLEVAEAGQVERKCIEFFPESIFRCCGPARAAAGAPVAGR